MGSKQISGVRILEAPPVPLARPGSGGGRAPRAPNAPATLWPWSQTMVTGKVEKPGSQAECIVHVQSTASWLFKSGTHGQQQPRMWPQRACRGDLWRRGAGQDAGQGRGKNPPERTATAQTSFFFPKAQKMLRKCQAGKR